MGNRVIYRPAYDAEVEYLESTGTQYIDTGVIPNFNYDMKIEVGAVLLTDGRSIICGNYITNDAGNFIYEDNINIEFGGNTSTKKVRIYTRFTTSSTLIDKYFSERNIYQLCNISFDYNSEAGTLTMSDGFDTDTVIRSNEHVSDNYNSLRLFSDYRVFQSSGYNCIRITYCKFTIGNTLVRDFIPVRIGSTGYMYDKVSKQLFGNKGTGQFILGNDVSNAMIPQQRCVILFPMYDSQVEYLESDGNSYIDTGLVTSSELGIIAHIAVMNNNTAYLFGGANGLFNAEYGFMAVDGNNTSSFRFGSKTTNHSLLNTGVNYEFDNTSNHNILTVGETSYQTQFNEFVSSYNFYLFAENRRGSSWKGAGVRIYDFKIYQNSTLVRDYIPVRIGSTGYMYDKVTKQLFENKGTGNFTLGNDTNDAVVSQRSVIYERIYEEYEWLVGDTSAYIDTLINPSFGDELDATFTLLSKPTVVNIYVLTATDDVNEVGFLTGGNFHSNDTPQLLIKNKPTATSGYIAWDTRSLGTTIKEYYMYMKINNAQIPDTVVKANGVICNYDVITGDNMISEVPISTYKIGKGYSKQTGLDTVKLKNITISSKINLVPCKLLQSIPAILDGNGIARQAGECGMWDKVSNKFYGNVANSGTFTVKNPKCYEEYKWLVGDTAYFVIPVNIYQESLYVKFHPTSSGSNHEFWVGFYNVSSDATIEIRGMAGGNNELGIRFGIRENSAATANVLNARNVDFLNDFTVETRYSEDNKVNFTYNGTSGTATPKIDSRANVNVYVAFKTTWCRFAQVTTDRINLIPCKLTHYIPASMDANGIARPAGTCGMWDKVNDKFYGNVANSGSFTVSNN